MMIEAPTPTATRPLEEDREMPLIVIHQVRRVRGLPAEPVGAWEVSGSNATPFYPPEHAKYLKRGEKALHERPTESLEAWVHFLVHTSRSWRIHQPGDASLFAPSPPDLTAAFLEEQKTHHKHVAALQEKQAAARPQAASRDASADAAGAAWGASRFAVAQSWWIASELVRRHPQLLIHEMHPGGGQYDVLCVTDPDSLSPHPVRAQSPRVMLNRVGTLQVHRGGESESVATWLDVLASPAPHSVVKQLERHAGWTLSGTTPPTTRRTLVYRFLATALAMTFNDRHTWDARNEFLDSSGGDSPRAGYLPDFPAAVEAARGVHALGIYGEPESHFWALRRGADTVAIVSIEGRAFFTDDTSIDLMAEYDAHNRRIIPMTARLLRDWL